MNEALEIRSALEEKFPYLKEAVKVDRERRVSLEVPYDKFLEVFDHAVKKLYFTSINTITGLDEGEYLAFIYHLSARSGIVLNLRTKVLKDKESIKTIISYFPSAAIYERELVDLLGAKVEGLPEGLRYPLPDGWPKGEYPLRKNWDASVLDKEGAGRVGYIEENIEIPAGEKQPIIKEPTSFGTGKTREPKEMMVPFGPQHPALKEPESFSVALRGEKIQSIQIRIGYNHRGIEKACETQTYIQDLYLIERICGICSHAHSTCYVQAVEEIAGLEIPRRAKYVRTLIAELERVHSHLLWLGVAGHEIGFDTLLMYTWRDREAVMDLLADITGNRVNYGINTIGGVRRDISKEQGEKTIEVVKKLEEETKYYIEVAEEEATLIQRLSGVGKLEKEDAIRLGAVGPTARASGLLCDVRKDDPYAAYGELDFKVITDDHCDVYGRTVVRLGELLEAYSMVRQLIKNMPDGPISIKAA
ncbi:MAG: NADH-quinone oxidoreductase subunit C [Candidatus Saganbacteria bacterium]|nr:NADH-quinone oxidoreductase subunit C [Candidatus Saganbacteria bacterium]